METIANNTTVVPPYDEEGEAADGSPTSHLRHLKEISYILEKLRSNRTRFLLAAAHRRRQQLGSFAATPKHQPENPLSLEFAARGQAEDGLEGETNLRHEYLLQSHRQQEREQQGYEHQKHCQRGGSSLDVELYSDIRSVGSSPDAPSNTAVDANLHSGAEASDYEKHAAEATAAVAAPDIEAALTYFCKRDTPSFEAGTVAQAAVDDTNTTPAAADRPGALAPTTVTAAGTAANAPSHWMGSFPARRESLFQRAPVTLDGDDIDLYLGELLVPLLHDGLVKLCHLVELKESDKTKQRLGYAFHENFNPLRWLGQYLMRHHPKNGGAQPGDTRFTAAVAPFRGSFAKCRKEGPVSAAAPGQNELRSRRETDSSAALEAADERAATTEAAMPQAATHRTTAETAQGTTVAGQATTPAAAVTATAAASAGGADSAVAEGTDLSPEEQTAIAAAVNLPAAATGADSAAALDGEAAAAEDDVEAEPTGDALAGSQTSTCSSQVESLHKRRMQQYASFYGVIKDIVDEERSRRDFLLRREEVKQIFEAYCREKNDPSFAQSVTGGRSSRSSCISIATGQWGKRLSFSLRRRSSAARDRILSFAAGNSPRKSRGTSSTRQSPRCTAVAAGASATGAAEGSAAEAQLVAEGGEASEGAAPDTPRGEMSDTPGRAAEGRAGTVSAGTSAPAATGSRENSPLNEVGEKVLRSEEEAQTDPLSKALGEGVAGGAAEGTEEDECFDCIPVSVEDFQDILERLDAHWEMGGRFVAVFEEGLPIPIATEHADLIQYLLPEQERELVIEDPEDVQADEFWEFVKCYAEVHTWIRRELYNKRKQSLQIRPAATNQQKLVKLLMKKKMVEVQQKGEEEEDEIFEMEEPEKE